MNTVTAKPFLKWAGGKSQLLDEIAKYYPFYDSNITKYAEPFVGGGAVLFDILNKFELEDVLVCDINAQLINAYLMIRDQADELINMLLKFQNEYWPLNTSERKKYYLQKREAYNGLITQCEGKERVEQAALMILLNKTCFNGLYRVNGKGQFNVPVGSYKNPLICDVENLRAVSKKLNGVKIVCGDYKIATDFIDSHTFVYFDPPYRPLTKTASFTAYTESAFDDADQRELAAFVDEMCKRGAKVVVSNSDPQNIDADDKFFEELYPFYNIARVNANRMINSNSGARGKIKELLISNYQRNSAINKKEGAKQYTNKNSNLTLMRGNKEMTRDFSNWFSRFRDSIADYGYYTDFEKIYHNVDKIKVELNILNALIGSKSIEKDFLTLVKRYPETLKCIPILLAVRANEIKVVVSEGTLKYNFEHMNYSPEQYLVFMRETGLFELLKNHVISNLMDYVTGVETGLDSNARKNRMGHTMENIVEGYITKAGFKKEETYFKEMYIHEVTEKWGIDLSALSNQGKMEKRFDFVVKTPKMIYGIETNFYGSSGSKLNETARSYKTLALEADTIDGFTFVWFTDGKGWTSARNNLEETFDVLEHIYSIADLEDDIISEVFV